MLNLHFLENLKCSVFSYASVPTVYLPGQGSAHFLVGLLVFLLLSSKSSLCIFSDLSFTNTFSQPVACLLILFPMSFAELRILIFMKSGISILSFMDCDFCAIFLDH